MAPKRKNVSTTGQSENKRNKSSNNVSDVSAVPGSKKSKSGKAEKGRRAGGKIPPINLDMFDADVVDAIRSSVPLPPNDDDESEGGDDDDTTLDEGHDVETTDDLDLTLRQELVKPAARSRKFHLSTADGAEVTSGQYSASKDPWTEDEDVKLVAWRNAGWSLEHIALNVLPHREYASCNGRWSRLADKCRKGERPKYKEKNAQVQVSVDDVFSASQARMFYQLKAAYRTVPGSKCFQTFPNHRDDVRPDLSNMSCAMQDWLLCNQRLQKSDTIVPLPVILVNSFNLGCSQSEKAEGMLRYDKDGNVYFALVQWTEGQQAEYQEQSPYQRSIISGVGIDWLWSRLSEKVLRILVKPSTVDPNQGEKQVSTFEVDKSAYASARGGTSHGPVLIIVGGGALVLSTLSEVILQANTKSGVSITTTPMKGASGGARLSVTLEFTTSSNAYKTWSATRSLPMDAQLQDNLRRKLCVIHSEGKADLESWAAVVQTASVK